MFAEQPGSLQYWPAKSARVLQCVGALGIAFVSVFLGLLTWKAQPLTGLLGEGDEWNSLAVGLLFAFAGLLLLAVPFYLRGARTPYTLERGSTILRHGRRKVMDFQDATGVSIMARRVGEANDILVFSVAFGGTPQPLLLPLLTFDQKEDAQRIAANISASLVLPMV